MGTIGPAEVIGATTAQANGSVSVSVSVGIVAVIGVAVVVGVSNTAIAIAAAAAAVIGVRLHVSILMIAAPLSRFIVDWSANPSSYTVPVTPLNLYLIITTIIHAIADLSDQRNRCEN